MDVIEKLLAGHREVLERRDILAKLSKEADSDAFFWDNAIRLSGFFQKEVRQHFAIEEKAFFPVMRTVLPAGKQALVDELENEHRAITAKLSQVEEFMKGHLRFPSKATRQEMVRAIAGFLELLLAHAQREDKEFYALVRGSFKPEHYQELERLARLTPR